MSDAGAVDLLVIGGGVNGAGIARDAAGRGLSVVLCEKDDLAQGTSSRSGKLIHGGLRYLEYYEFRLVREALIEREVLLAAAPHIIWPLRFVLPHSPQDRPAWLIRLGLLLYDHLARRKRLPGSRSLDLRHAPEGAAIEPGWRRAFEYSDCWVDDARLVVLNARDAAAHGARILTRTACVAARRDGGLWHAELEVRGTGLRSTVRARALVNAAGPWVEDVLTRVAGARSARRVRLVKGSHLVVRRFWDGPNAWLLQNPDRRVIFAVPYEDDLALIGTTDIPYEGSADDVAIDATETDYLLAVVNRFFRRKLTRADIVSSFSGVRPLYDDAAANPSAVTRDYVLDLDTTASTAPLLSVFGGKITTFRKLAEQAMVTLAPHFPAMGPAWTAAAPLPGGDFTDPDALMRELRAAHPWLPDGLPQHLVRLYGTLARELLGNASSVTDLGRPFGGLLYEREVRYLMAQEWARTAADILERRTKHGLHLAAAQQQDLAQWMDAQAPLPCTTRKD